LISNGSVVVDFICLRLVIHCLPDLCNFVEFSLLASLSWSLTFTGFSDNFLLYVLFEGIIGLYLAGFIEGFLD